MTTARPGTDPTGGLGTKVANPCLGGSTSANKGKSEDDADDQRDRFVIVVQPENSAVVQTETVTDAGAAGIVEMTERSRLSTDESSPQESVSVGLTESYCKSTLDSNLSGLSGGVGEPENLIGVTLIDVTAASRVAETGREGQLLSDSYGPDRARSADILSSNCQASRHQQVLCMVNGQPMSDGDNRQAVASGSGDEPHAQQQHSSTISVSQLHNILNSSTDTSHKSVYKATSSFSSSVQAAVGQPSASPVTYLSTSRSTNAESGTGISNSSHSSSMPGANWSQSLNNSLIVQKNQPHSSYSCPPQTSTQMMEESSAITSICRTVLQPSISVLQGQPIREQFLPQQQHMYQPQTYQQQQQQLCNQQPQQHLDYQGSSVQQTVLTHMTPIGMNQPPRALYDMSGLTSSTGSTYSAQLPLVSSSPAGSCGSIAGSFPVSTIMPQQPALFGPSLVPGSIYPGSAGGIVTYQPSLSSASGALLQTMEGQAVQWSGTFVTQAAGSDLHKQNAATQIQTAAAAATVVNQQTVQNLITVQPPPQQQQQQPDQSKLQQQLQQDSNTMRTDSLQTNCESGITQSVTGGYVHHHHQQQQQQQQQQFMAWASTAVGQAQSATLANQQLQYIQQPQQQIQLQQQQLMFQNMMMPSSGMLQNGQLQQQNTSVQQLRQGQQLALNIGAIGGAQLFTATNGQQHIRFASPPNFITNTGQILAAGSQTLLSMGQFQMPILQSTLLPNQATAFLGSQPLYIQAAPSADNFNHQQQQQQLAMIGNIQSVTPVKNIANIAPQTARASSTQPRRVQVLPNNTSSNSSSSHASLLSNTKHSANRGSPKVRPLAKTPPSLSSISSASARSVIAGPTCCIVTSANQKLPTVAVAPSLAKDRAASSTSSIEVKSTSASCIAVRINASPLISNHCITAMGASIINASSPSISCSVPVCQVKSETMNIVTESSISADTLAQGNLHSIEYSQSSTLPYARTLNSEVGSVLADVSVSPVTTPLSGNSVVPGNGVVSIAPTRPICEAVGNVAVQKHMTPLKKSRPKILTHIIEGFIIQEATEPFPVNRKTLMSQFLSSNVPVPIEASGTDSVHNIHSTDQGSDKEDDKSTVAGVEVDSGYEFNSVPNDKSSGRNFTTVAASAEEGCSDRAVHIYDDGIPRLVCEFCGKLDVITNFARSRRFCSVTCSKRYSAYSQRKASTSGSAPAGIGSTAISRPLTKRGGLSLGVSSLTTTSAAQIVHFSPVNKLQKITLSTYTAADPSSTHSASVVSHAETLSGGPIQRSTSINSTGSEMSLGGSLVDGGTSSSMSQSPPQLERMELDDGEVAPPSSRPLAEWGVEEVYEFVRRLPGCESYAEEFRTHEIDGQALTLLKEDHLMMTLNVKLGPALKICQRINALK